MRDYLRRLNWKPRLEQCRGKLLHGEIDRFQKVHGRGPDTDELRQLIRQAAVNKFERKNKRRPTPDEQAGLLKLSEKAFRKILASGRPGTFVSFTSAVGGERERDAEAMDGFKDPRLPTPLTRAERSDLKRWITHGFARRDRLIIILYYYEQLTMKEIGRTLGCSESRVSQRLDSIIRSLRSRLNRTGSAQELV
jgi:RNA polymerase sigma factor for flagellar operon FliA